MPWKTYPIDLRNCTTSKSLMSFPSMEIVPEDGSINRLIIFIVVLFPLCEQPRKVAGVKARKIAEGERLRMIKSSG